MTERQKPSNEQLLSVQMAATRRDPVDPRARAAWCTWLAALAKEPDAVTAAALAYEALDNAGRTAWLDALDADAADVGVPRVALYAPLLSVEEDPDRRTRMLVQLVGEEEKRTPPRALVGALGDDRVCLIVTALYLDFVEVLFCRYDPELGVRDAWHRWLVHTSELASCIAEVGAPMSEGSLDHVVEQLAHAVVADRRAGRSASPTLVRCIDLFVPDLARPAQDGRP